MLNSRSLNISETMTIRQKAARTVALRLLTHLSGGQLCVIESFNVRNAVHPMWFGSQTNTSLLATLEIKSPTIYQTILRKGSIGAGESYQRGEWDSPDLSAFMALMATNLNLIDQLEAKSQWLPNLWYRMQHWTRRNSEKNSKHNIHVHYDLGNSLYATFLDTNMLYSSALFRRPTDTLEQAQINKMERLCQQLQLKANDQVLEIGTGWGGMAIYMATQYGCHVTTTTISDEQYTYTRHKIKRLGLEQQITLLKQDYRNLRGKYDKLVSIEMVEAVGQQYLPGYIKQCHELLKPDGLLCLQAITIADQRFDYYRHHVDFIQAYIFPGGFLPSLTALLKSTSRHSSFVIRNLYDMGLDYAQTLKEWQHRFNRAEKTVRDLGYDTEFIRLWRYYLSYCEGAFRAKRISCVQMMFQRA